MTERSYGHTLFEVSDNGTVTDKGIVILRKIETLRRLKLQNLPGVSDPRTVLEKIKQGCNSIEIFWLELWLDKRLEIPF